VAIKVAAKNIVRRCFTVSGLRILLGGGALLAIGVGLTFSLADGDHVASVVCGVLFAAAMLCVGLNEGPENLVHFIFRPGRTPGTVVGVGQTMRRPRGLPQPDPAALLDPWPNQPAIETPSLIPPVALHAPRMLVAEPEPTQPVRQPHLRSPEMAPLPSASPPSARDRTPVRVDPASRIVVSTPPSQDPAQEPVGSGSVLVPLVVVITAGIGGIFGLKKAWDWRRGRTQSPGSAAQSHDAVAPTEPLSTCLCGGAGSGVLRPGGYQPRGCDQRRSKPSRAGLHPRTPGMTCEDGGWNGLTEPVEPAEVTELSSPGEQQAPVPLLDGMLVKERSSDEIYCYHDGWRELVRREDVPDTDAVVVVDDGRLASVPLQPGA
jgi:hypothetical protein